MTTSLDPPPDADGIVGTDVPDSTYDLVVLLQQALEDGTRYQHFARDARADGDEELAAFFDELALNDRGVAARARRLLAGRL